MFHSKLIYSLLACFMLAFTGVVWSSDIDLADEPLAIKTEGVSPNILLLIDDSSSMSCHWSGCGDDVFYAPGYRSDLEYRCPTGAILEPDNNETVTIMVSKRNIFGADYTGTPYFSYNGNTYGWGGSGLAYETGDVFGSIRLCFDPEEEYQVKLQANDCSDSDYCVATGDTETFDGNFLNWYFSATLAEWGDNTLSGGYKDYGNNGWDEQIASNFITEHIHYREAGNGDVYPEYTEIHGSRFNENSKTWFPAFPRFSNTNSHYLGREYDGGWHNQIDSNPNITHFHSGASESMIGMKPGVSHQQFRLNVAKDVAKQLVRQTNNAYFAIASFATKVTEDNGSFDLEWGNYYSRYLVHGFAEVTDDNTEESDDNRESLIQAIDLISGDTNTPTSQTMVAAARYFFNGWETETFDYLDDGDENNDQTIEDVFNLEFFNLSSDQPPAFDSSKKNITEENWCQKNAMAVLTDGIPSADYGYAGSDGYLEDYDTVGVLDEPAHGTDTYNTSGMVRVPGALYDHDFLPDLRGKQNIESFMIAFGADEVINNDDFKKAGLAGGGGKENFYAASNGADVVDAFKDIVEKVSAASASVTAVAVSAVSELETENYAIQATYDTQFWTSSVIALNLDADGKFVNPDGSNPSDSSNGIEPEWEANQVMSAMYVLNDDDISGFDVSTDYRSVLKRKVFTWSGSQGLRFGSDNMTRPATSSSALQEFNSLPAALQSDLDVVADGDTQERYDLMMFLLGDVSNEQSWPVSGGSGKYRQRGIYINDDGDNQVDNIHSGGLLGDVIHSSPVYVQKPSRQWNEYAYGEAGKTYQDYRDAQEGRAPMVYFGSNDGMVHGISIEAGSQPGVDYPAGGELFAYMPLALASADSDKGFHFLASRDYKHRYYADLSLSVSDVFMDFYNSGSASEPLSPEWRTILVSGLRAGGNAIFALDVTCPYRTPGSGNTCSDESFDTNNILWEFDNADDADLGKTYSEPVIAKVNYDNFTPDDEERNGNNNGRWAAIVGNGYNSSNGRAALYLLFLDGGVDGSWTEGVDYLKLYVSDSTTDNASSKNGLSSPQAVDIDNDGLIDRVYAGDLKGQMWSFDLSTAVDKYDFDNDTVPWLANKLFTTGISANNTQPITTAPMVARDGSVSASDPNLMVVFATGSYLQESDLQDKSIQSVYAVHDRGAHNLNRYDVNAVNGLPLLEPRFFSESAVTVNSQTQFNRSPRGDNVYWATQYGWYADLASDTDENNMIEDEEITGERVAFNPFLANNLFVFNSIIPVVASCTGATEGWTMLIDWRTGLAPPFASYDANLDSLLNDDDIGYVGYYNDEAGSQLGRGGDNIYDSIGEWARRKGVDFGSTAIGYRLGWEERFPFGVIK